MNYYFGMIDIPTFQQIGGKKRNTLHHSIKLGDINQVRRILENITQNELHYVDKNMTPLILAIRYNHSEIAKTLIEHPSIIIQQVIKYDSDPNSMTETNALAEAIKSRNKYVINLLIQNGADPTRTLHV